MLIMKEVNFLYYSEEVKEFTKKLAFFPEEGKSLSGIINNIRDDTKDRRLKNSLEKILDWIG